jgi:uncharacterized protein YcbX
VFLHAALLPRTGGAAGEDLLRVGCRRAAAGGVAFGTNYAVLRSGRIRVGDEVTVDVWGESEV